MKLISHEILISFGITIAGYRIFAVRVCDVQIILLNTLFKVLKVDRSNIYCAYRLSTSDVSLDIHYLQLSPNTTS